MLLLALADVGGLCCFGTLFGYAMINGMVYCSSPLLGWTVGSGELCKRHLFFVQMTTFFSVFWTVSSCNCVLLVLNRICELTEMSWIFQVQLRDLYFRIPHFKLQFAEC